MLLNKLTDLTVEELGAHALTNKRVCVRECLARNFSRFAHQPQLIGIFNNDHRLNTKCTKRQSCGVFHTFLSHNELQDTRFRVVFLEGLRGAVIHFKTT